MRQQQGWSVIRLLLWLTLFLVIGYISWLVVPVYLQNFQVQQALEGVSKLELKNVGNGGVVDPEKIKALFNKQLDSYGVDNFQLDALTVKPNTKGGYTISFKYWVVKPVVSNMNLMFHFEEQQEVTIDTK